jgi:hypothetical protein
MSHPLSPQYAPHYILKCFPKFAIDRVTTDHDTSRRFEETRVETPQYIHDLESEVLIAEPISTKIGFSDGI